MDRAACRHVAVRGCVGCPAHASEQQEGRCRVLQRFLVATRLTLGTGSHPGLGPKRQGRPAPGRAGRQYQLSERLVRNFVVPKSLETTGVCDEFGMTVY